MNGVGELQRKLTKPLQELLTESDVTRVILVEGPRQVGKTTLVKNCLASLKIPHLSLNLERDRRYGAAIDRCDSFERFQQWLKDEFNFVPDGSRILFIDEAQESRELGRFVRFMKEDWHNVKTVLTGSMMTRLFHEDIRYPVGRVNVVAVQPISFFEYLEAIGRKDWLKIIKSGELKSLSSERHEKLLAELNLYLNTGGLPEVIKSRLGGKKYRDTLVEIYEQYRQDFMRVYGPDQGFLFEKALQAVADHVGSPSKFTQAVPAGDSRYSGVATAFARLESWRMILTSPQRGPYPEGTTDFHPKRYLFDLGLLSYLRTLGVPDLSVLKTQSAGHRDSLGGVLENFTAFCLTNLGLSLHGYKKHAAGMEIDFIAKTEKFPALPIECKAALKIKGTHLTGLKTYLNEYGLKTAVMVSAAPFEVRKYSFGKIVIVPFYALEALPELLAL